MAKRQDDIIRGWPRSWNWGIYTISDVVQILCIPRRKILLFIEQGIIAPSAPAIGRGRPNLFNVGDLLKIVVTHQLERFGIAPRKLRDFLLDFFKPFLVGQSVLHKTSETHPHMLIRPEDFEGQGDPLRLLKSYAEMLEFDQYAVFVTCEGERESGIYRIRVPQNKIGDGISGKVLLDILAKHPSAVIVNLKHIVDQLEERIGNLLGEQ